MTKAQSIGKVEGLGEIFQVAASLDGQIASLKEAGVSHPYLVGVDDTAQIRLAGVSNDFTRTHIAPVALKGKPTLLYRPSDLMSPVMAFMAVQAHRKGEYVKMPGEFYESVEQIAKSEEGLEPEDRTAIALPGSDDFNLTSEMEPSRFLFRNFAKPYFAEFTQGTIPFENLKADAKGVAILNYLWFNFPQGGSLLSGWGWGLSRDGSGFGVRVAEGDARKNFGYSLTDIRTANTEAVAEVLAQQNVGGLTEMLSKPLGAKLLERLRK